MIVSIAFLGLSTLACILLLARTAAVTNKHRYVPAVLSRTTELPTVSVCIAARNEMHALAQCLERVLASDYEKLEILVLDDESEDNTPFIIKSFASAGVRFIPSSKLPEGWLGKNHAYKTLLDEASGELVIFMDVDTTLRTSTIRQLVNQMTRHDLSMLSVVPIRLDSYRLSAIFGTFRYYWELLLATTSTPPIASALWIANRQHVYNSDIELSSYGTSLRPERHLAKRFASENKYQLVISTKGLGIGFEKRVASQYQTAIRLYYPMTGKKFIYCSLSCVFLAGLLLPLWQLGSDSVILKNWALGVLLLNLASFTIFAITFHSGVYAVLRIFILPVILIIEILLLIASYILHAFGMVTWKGRPVTTLKNSAK